MGMYWIKVGNTKERKGHRRDCSQVSVSFLVQGDSRAHAAARFKLACRNCDSTPEESPHVKLLRVEVNCDNIGHDRFLEHNLFHALGFLEHD